MKSIWSMGPDRWPRDAADYVFLARAVDALGRHLFGTTWKPEDDLRTLRPLPCFLDGVVLLRPEHRDARLQAHKVLSASGLEYVPRPRPFKSPAALLELMDFEFMVDEWAMAQQLIAKCLEPLFKVRQIIVEEATMGRLQTVRRPKGNVVWTPIDPDIWSVIRPDNIFEWCQIDPAQPAHYAVAGDAFEWVFVVRQSLNELVERLASPATDLAEELGGAARPGPNLKQDSERIFKGWVAINEGKRPPDRDQDLAYMRQFFPNINKGRVRDLRRDLAPEAWHKPGRRRAGN